MCSGPFRGAQGGPFHARRRQATPDHWNGAPLAHGKTVPYQPAAPSRDVDGGHPGESAQDRRMTFPVGRPRRALVPDMRGQGRRKGQGSRKETQYAAQRAAPGAERPQGCPRGLARA